VKISWTWVAAVGAKSRRTAFPVSGSKVWGALGSRVVKFVPSVLVSTSKFWVRSSHKRDGFSDTAIVLIVLAVPKSMVNSAGKPLLSQ